MFKSDGNVIHFAAPKGAYKPLTPLYGPGPRLHEPPKR